MLLSGGAPAGGTILCFHVEMACNGMFGTCDGIKPPDPNRRFTLKEVDLAVPNVPVVQVVGVVWTVGSVGADGVSRGPDLMMA